MKKKLQLLILFFPSLIFGQIILKVNASPVIKEQTITNAVKILYNPVLDTILPHSVHQGDTVTFTITAHNTHFTQGISNVKISTSGIIYYHYSFSDSVINDTTLLSKFIFFYTLPPGAYDFCIQSTTEGSICMNSAISILAGSFPPSITITPDSAFQGQTVHFTIKGTNTHFLQYYGIDMQNAYNTIYPDSFNIINDTLITADYSFDYMDHPNTYNVLVYMVNSIYGFYKISNGFTLKAGPHIPVLKSITPSSASQGDTLTLHITGNNTHFLSGINTIKIGTYPPTSINIINDSTINAFYKFTYNMYTSNNYILKLTDAVDGSLILPNSFALLPGANPPSLKNIIPSYAETGDTVTISLIGKNTTFSIAPNTFSLQNIYGQTIFPINVSCVNDTLMKAVFYFTASDSLGQYNIKVPSTSYTPALTLNNAFTLYPSRACIIHIYPDSAIIGNSLTITVNSLNSHYLAGTNTVLLQSIYGLSPLLGTNLSVINDSTLTADFNFTNSNINGKYNLIVDNAIDSTMKIDTAFTLNIATGEPHIANVNPCYVYFNNWVSLTVKATGTHFLQSIDSLKLCNLQMTIHPISINIINDTVIVADFLIPPENYPKFYNLSYLDIVVFGNMLLALPNAVCVSWPINVTEVYEQEQIFVYPNPAKDNLTIETLKKSTIEILNLQGQIILQQHLQQGKTEVDISGLAKGFYFLRLYSNGKTAVKKILKE